MFKGDVEADEEEEENRTGEGDDFALRNVETRGGSQDSESVTIGVQKRLCECASCSRIREIDRRQVGLRRGDV